MRLDRVRFETYAPPTAPDPARMDVAVFVGLVRERPGAPLPEALRAVLVRRFGDGPAALAAAGDRLLSRPVPVSSLQDFEALYDADARLESVARVTGNRLLETLPVSAPLLQVVSDGAVHAVELAPPPGTPDALLAALQAAGLPVTARLEGATGDRRLVFERPVARGAGTLAVLAQPAYGFPATRRAAARTIAGPLGMAVRQFFAMGGSRAIVVRVGDPVPYAATPAERDAALWRLMVGAPGGAVSRELLLAGLSRPSAGPETEAPARWGAEHLHDLDGATFVLFPDLPELCAPPPELAPAVAATEAPEEVFAECLPALESLADAEGSTLAAPVLDAAGAEVWRACIERQLRLIRLYLGDKLLLAALPRLVDGIDPAAILPRSAFLQVAGPWVRTLASEGAPSRLMAADAVLAGHLAAQALQRGTHVSAAPAPVPMLRDIERAAAPAAPVCWLEREPRGVLLSADLTTSADPAWADGPVSRLMAMLLRSARRIGTELVFAANDARLWRQVEGALRALLEEALSVGALRGVGEGDSYTIRCDASTMSQADLDAGRLIAEVSFAPAVPVGRITVRLPIGAGAPVAGSGGPQ